VSTERKRFPVGVHLLLFANQCILLTRRRNTGYYDGSYGLVAGHMEGAETVAKATIREAREEAGIIVSDSALRLVGIMHRRSDEERVEFFHAAHSWDGKITNNEPQKASDINWFNTGELPDNTIPYIRKAINMTLGSGDRIWFDEPDF
jgi:8-oxo-dGTP diphosphatase